MHIDVPNNYCSICNTYFRYTNHRRKHKCKRVLPNALHYEMLQKHKRGKHKSSPKAKIKSDIIGVNEKSTTAENFDGRILDAEIVNEGYVVASYLLM